MSGCALTNAMVLTIPLRLRSAEKEEARRRALEGLSGVNALLKKFSEDEDLRDDLKHPATRVVRMELRKHLVDHVQSR